jgi:copper chaperone CopZ
VTDIETVVAVRGMTCANCVRHVDQAVRSVAGVRDVNIDLASGRVRIRHAGADLQNIAAAIDDAGYEADLGLAAGGTT